MPGGSSTLSRTEFDAALGGLALELVRMQDWAKAKDRMFDFTDLAASPWWVIHGDDKRRARLNCIAHLLSQIPYENVEPPPLEIPERRAPDPTYRRPPIEFQRWVPDRS